MPANAHTTESFFLNKHEIEVIKMGFIPTACTIL